MDQKIPKRMRGYYRALRRKEAWATRVAKYPQGSLSWHLTYYFAGVDWAEALLQKPWFKVQGEAWRGAYIPIPVVKK